MENSNQTAPSGQDREPEGGKGPGQGTGERSEFEMVKERLEEIVRAVDDDALPLDEALDLYEEAVKLGLQASNLLDIGIVVDDAEESDDAAVSNGAAGDEAAPDASASARAAEESSADANRSGANA